MGRIARSLARVALAVPFAGSLAAEPITFRFEGMGDATLDGVPHPGAHYIIILEADTANVTPRVYGYDVFGPASFEITGVASGTFTLPTRVFNNTIVAIAGFSGTQGDMLDFADPLLSTYALNSALGPIHASPPYPGTFSGVATSVGTLSLQAFDLSFTASLAPCYADCNGDGALDLSDFGCFQTRFSLADPYADCNGDQVLNLSDFGCFQTKFALGCP
jgi:hypothetical protein